METSKFKYNTVSCDMLADMYTPVSVYMRMRYR